MVKRAGATTLGCLFTMIVLVGGVYYGKKVGQVYWNYSVYKNAIVQHTRLAETLTDAQIRARLAAKSDSLNLPDEAEDVTVVRTGRHISIAADYSETVDLPLQKRTFHFTPKAEYDY